MTSKPTAVAKAPAPPADAAPAPAHPPLKKGSITDKQRDRLFAIAKKAGWTGEQLKEVVHKKFKFESTRDITWSSYEAICDYFSKPPADDVDEDERRRLEQLARDEAEEAARRAAEDEDLFPEAR